MRGNRTREAYDQLLQTLAEERAAALVRISRRLESLIERLHDIRERLTHLEGPDREQELQAWHEVRKQALRYRWYLEVQRESVGLRQHQVLDEFYRVPTLER